MIQQKTQNKKSGFSPQQKFRKILTETHIKFNGWELHAKAMKMKHIKCTLNMKSTTNTENEKLHSRSQRLRNKESGNWCQQDGIIFKWEKKNTAGTKQVLWEYWTREEWLLLENLWTDNYFSQSYTSLQYTLSKAKSVAMQHCDFCTTVFLPSQVHLIYLLQESLFCSSVWITGSNTLP